MLNFHDSITLLGSAPVPDFVSRSVIFHCDASSSSEVRRSRPSSALPENVDKAATVQAHISCIIIRAIVLSIAPLPQFTSIERILYRDVVELRAAGRP